MTMTCSPKVLNEICETYPEITVAEFIAILQVRRLKEEQEEMRICTNRKRQNRSRIWHDTSIKRKVPL